MLPTRKNLQIKISGFGLQLLQPRYSLFAIALCFLAAACGRTPLPDEQIQSPIDPIPTVTDLQNLTTSEPTAEPTAEATTEARSEKQSADADVIFS